MNSGKPHLALWMPHSPQHRPPHKRKIVEEGFILFLLLAFLMPLAISGWFVSHSRSPHSLGNQLASLLRHTQKGRTLDLITIHLSKSILSTLHKLHVLNALHQKLTTLYRLSSVLPIEKTSLLKMLQTLTSLENTLHALAVAHITLQAQALCTKNHIEGCLPLSKETLRSAYPLFRLAHFSREHPLAPLTLSPLYRQKGYLFGVFPITALAKASSSQGPHSHMFYEHELACIHITFPLLASAPIPTSLEGQSTLCPTYRWVEHMP